MPRLLPGESSSGGKITGRPYGGRYNYAGSPEAQRQGRGYVAPAPHYTGGSQMAQRQGRGFHAGGISYHQALRAAAKAVHPIGLAGLTTNVAAQQAREKAILQGLRSHPVSFSLNPSQTTSKGVLGSLGSVASDISHFLTQSSTEMPVGPSKGQVAKEALGGVEKAGAFLAQPAKSPYGRIVQPVIGRHALSHLGDTLVPNQPGVQSAGLSRGALNLAGKVAGNAALEAADFPAQSLQTAAVTGKAAIQAAQGNTKPLKQLGEATLEPFKHPGKSLVEHPLTTALLFAGPEAAVGRSLGGAMRTGALGADAARVASRERPLHIYAGPERGPVVVRREYSPDVFRKAFQVTAERARGHVKLVPRMVTKEEASSPSRGLIGKHIRHMVDTTVGTGYNIVRGDRAEALRIADKSKPKAGHENVVPLVEGTVRPPTEKFPNQHVEDVGKEINRLADQTPHLTGEDRAANLENIKALTGLFKDESFHANPLGHPVTQAAQDYLNFHLPREQELLDVGGLTKGQQFAKYYPYAISHMGAKLAKDETGRLQLVAPTHTPHPDPAVEAGAAAYRDRMKGHGAQHVTNTLANFRAELTEGQRIHDLNAQSGAPAHVLATSRDNLAMVREIVTQLQRAQEELHGGGAVRPLSADAIRQHMAEHGVKDVGFVSHHDRGTGAYYVNEQQRRPAVMVPHRTGTAYANGSYDRSYDALRAEYASMATRLAGHRGRNAMLQTYGVGSFDSPREAQRAIDNLTHTAEGKQTTNAIGGWSVVHTGPEPVREAGAVHPGSVDSLFQAWGITPHKGFDENPPSDVAPKYTLVPNVVLKRIGDHARLMDPGTMGALGRMYTNRWRQTALFTSPRWLLGSPQEHGIRVVQTGAFHHPIEAVRMTKALDAIADQRVAVDKDMAQRAKEFRAGVFSRASGHGFAGTYGAAEKQPFVVADKFVDTAAESLMRVHGAAFGSKPWRVTSAPWRAWHGLISKEMKGVDRTARGLHLSKQEHRQFTAWRRAQQGAHSELGNVYQDYLTHKLNDMGSVYQTIDKIDKAAGRWDRLPPSLKQMQQMWAPFGLWWVTSLRYLAKTLPADHPYQTAIYAALYQATEQARHAKGQGYNAPSPVPDFLQGTVNVHLPIAGDVNINPTYYTPQGLGLLRGAGTAADMIFPQVTDTLSALKGTDSLTGQTLKVHGKDLSPGQIAAVFLRAQAEGLIPGLRQLRQYQEKGGKSEALSMPFAPLTKPGTQRGTAKTLFKMLFPTRVVFPGKGSATGGGGGKAGIDRGAIGRSTYIDRGTVGTHGTYIDRGGQ